MRGGDLRLATVVATSADGMKRFRAAPMRRANPPGVWLSRNWENWLWRQEIKDVEQERSCRVATIRPGPRRPIGASSPNRHRVSTRITES